MNLREGSFLTSINGFKNTKIGKNKNDQIAEKLHTIENFLANAESTIQFHLNGIYFMDEEEIRSYLIQLQLLSELTPVDLERQYDLEDKLNKILDEYSQIMMDISQETNNSSFDVNLLTNANFLSNSGSSDSGITPDVIPETQKFATMSQCETRGRKKKQCFSEYTKHAILTKRHKIMPNNEIIKSETDILDTIIQDSQNCITVEEISQELESTILTTKSIDKCLDQVKEIEDGISDAETDLFDIENMEICSGTENAAVSSNSEEMTEYSNTRQGNRIASPKQKYYVEKGDTTSEYTEDIIKETQIISNYKSFRKNDVSSTGCQNSGIITNKPTKQIGNFGSRYNNSLTNISSTQTTSCATSNEISTQKRASTIPPTFNTANNSSIGQTIPHTSLNTDTILYTALPNNEFVKIQDSNSRKNNSSEKSQYTSQFEYFENVKYVDNKPKGRGIKYIDSTHTKSKTNESFIETTAHIQNKLPLLENLLPEDAYFAKSSTSHNFTDKTFIGNAICFDVIQSEESQNIFPKPSEDYSTNSSKTISNSRNEYEISSSEANVNSCNEEQDNVITFSTISRISSAGPNNNVLKNLMETQNFSASFQTNLMKDLKSYSEINEYKMQTSFKKIETKSNNPFLCKERKELLCEAMDPKSNERRRNKLVDQDIDTMTDMFADVFRNHIRLADLNKSDLHKKLKNDSNIL